MKRSMLITREFSILVLFANLIAWPVAWFLMRSWLTGFPYRINMGIFPFLFSALLAMVLAMITVVLQGWRAANRNPVDALRHD